MQFIVPFTETRGLSKFVLVVWRSRFTALVLGTDFLVEREADLGVGHAFVPDRARVVPAGVRAGSVVDVRIVQTGASEKNVCFFSKCCVLRCILLRFSLFSFESFSCVASFI